MVLCTHYMGCVAAIMPDGIEDRRMYYYAVFGRDGDGSYLSTSVVRFCSKFSRRAYVSRRPHFSIVSAREAIKFANRHGLTIRTVRGSELAAALKPTNTNTTTHNQ
jgi:hypothetical protein